MYHLTFPVATAEGLRIQNDSKIIYDSDTYPQYAEFKLADNILHLIYNQGILWLACYFSPAFPIIHMVKIVMIFYLRNWSVLTTNLPSKRIFRASRSNSFYLVLLLLMLLARFFKFQSKSLTKKFKILYFKTYVSVIMLPIVYSLFSIESSSKCGPFSKIPEIQFSYEIVNWTINLLNVKLISSVYKMVMSPTVILIRVQR